MGYFNLDSQNDSLQKITRKHGSLKGLNHTKFKDNFSKERSCYKGSRLQINITYLMAKIMQV